MLIDLGGKIINTAHIVSMSASAGVRGGRQWSITFTSGEKITVQDHPDLDEQVCGTIVSAPPGLTLVESFHPDRGDEDQSVTFHSLPVLAFRITSPGVAPTPIGIFGGLSSGSDNYAVLQPDGTCFGWERVWESLDAFKAEQQTLYDEQRRPSQPKVAASPVDDRPQPPLPATQDRYEPAKKPSSAPETIEQLRARILAEPILKLTPDAPWRSGRDFAEVIAAVRDANPELHTAGVGHDPKWGWKWRPGDMERHREAMTEPGLVEEFERALRFLSYAGQRFGQAKVNRKRTSYAWKHVAERVMGAYVSNGMLVTAAYALGFTVATNDSPNPYINLGDKAAELDPHGGL